MTAEQALADNLDSVRRLGRSFQKYGYDAEDMAQQACLIFLEHWHKKPEHWTIGNYIASYVNWRMIDYTEGLQLRKAQSSPSGKPYDPAVTVSNCPLVDLVDSLSDDARTVLNLFLDMPAELRSIFRTRATNKQRDIITQPIVNHLRQSQGWTIQRARESMQSLEVACTH